MKVFCCLLVLFAVLQASQSKNANSRRFIERMNLRTTFNRRLRTNVDPLIVGGRPADIADFPHQLALLDLRFGGFICGASNISPGWALSAAHCLEMGSPASSINLWGGSTSRLSGGVLFFVTQYILHPQYDDWTLDNDVAVIRVDPSTPLQGHPHVRPISLPPNCASACCGVCVAGPDITVAGWGVDDTNTAPENLRQVQKAIFNQAECSRIWGGGITSGMFCTNVENGMDSCSGDSGSPIIRSGIQVGVVSFGSEVCGDGSAPAVYIRLEAPIVRNFIRQHTGI